MTTKGDCLEPARILRVVTIYLDAIAVVNGEKGDNQREATDSVQPLPHCVFTANGRAGLSTLEFYRRSEFMQAIKKLNSSAPNTTSESLPNKKMGC
jgi:hypothetical protein